jgi:hypothetical protein
LSPNARFIRAKVAEYRRTDRGAAIAGQEGDRVHIRMTFQRPDSAPFFAERAANGEKEHGIGRPGLIVELYVPRSIVVSERRPHLRHAPRGSPRERHTLIRLTYIDQHRAAD